VPVTYADQHRDQRCVHCETQITAGDWYPAVMERDDDGALTIHYFCTQSCRREWEAEG